MDLVFSFKDINPNNEPEWTCPHCSRVFATSRTHYYNSHHGGRCLLSAGQQATAHKGIEQLLTEDGAYIDELGNEYTGEAALLSMQHDAARADLEQRCIELGVTQEQLSRTLSLASQQSTPTAACAPTTCTSWPASCQTSACTGATPQSGLRTGWSVGAVSSHAARAAGWCRTQP